MYFLPKKFLDQVKTRDELEQAEKAEKLRRRIEGVDKVFCSECKYYDKRNRFCEHPNNFELIEKYDWEWRWTESKRKSSPSWRNSNNSCEDYVGR